MYAGTNTSLTGGATYTSMTRMTNRDDAVAGTIFANQAGTLFIEQSSDPAAANPATSSTANWDVSTSYAILASDGKGFVEPLVAPYWRIRYLNGAAAQGTFRLHARSSSGGDS